MDENNITPELDNTNETEDTQVQSVAADDAETAQAEETVAEEKSDFEQFMSASENNENVEESGKEAETEEEVALAQDEKPKKKKRKALKVVIGILVAVLVAFVALMVVAIISMDEDSAELSVDADAPAITIDDVEVNAGEFVYMYSYFNSYYSSYYTSEQLLEYATEQLVYVNSLYKKAVEAGYTLSEDDYAEIDATIASVEESAETYSITVDEMLADYYFCEGYTVDMFRKYLEKEYLANAYYEDEIAVIEEQYYTGEDSASLIEKEYNDNKTAYDLSNASYYYFDSTEEGAQDTVDAIIAKVEAGTSFADALATVADVDSASSLQGYSMSVVSSNFSEDVANWLFETDENGEYVNGAGAISSFAQDDVIYVVCVDGTPARNEQIPVTVEYIVVEADTDTTVKTQEELMLAAKSTASSIISEFEAAGDLSVDAFIALEDTYNNGDNELVSASYFENMVNDGTYDEAVAQWVFDETRAVGDYALVEGDGCYYVLYFASVNDNPVWYDDIAYALYNEAVTSWSDEVVASYEDVIVKDEDVINAVVEYVSALYSSSASYGY